MLFSFNSWLILAVEILVFLFLWKYWLIISFGYQIFRYLFYTTALLELVDKIIEKKIFSKNYSIISNEIDLQSLLAYNLYEVSENIC